MSIRILHNAQIFTLDSSTPKASAMALSTGREGGRILGTGGDDQILAAYEGAASIQNMEGRTIVPGLTDAHIHLQHYALGLQKIDCEVPTKEECLHRVRERAEITPPGQWILGHGWNQNDWSAEFGSASDLDSVAPHHPVFLTAKSLHSSWANTAALQLAQINTTTPDPSGGVIQRDDKGNPTGILLEEATSLVSRVIPAPSLPELMAALLKAQTKLLAVGITSVHDFDAQACFSALQKIHAEGELKLRVVKSIPFEALPAAVSVGLRTGYGDDWLRIGNVKMFSDGALGPYTAAMLQPYENSPNNRGLLLMDAAQIYAEGRLAVDNGLALAIHAIGDRANHEVLNALARLRQQDTRLRHRIEHVQVLQPQDTHRLAELGVIASMQPIHTTSDMYMADAYWGKRAAYSYALKTQLEHGATLAFGSDAPVESPNPFWGIHAAVTRRRADGSPGPAGWYPIQRLPFHQAIAGFTTGAAIAAGMEDRQGKLVPGYFADLLVLDTNPFECNPDEIRNILPAATMVAGEWMTSEP